MSLIETALIGPGVHARRYLLPSISRSESLRLAAVIGGADGRRVGVEHSVPWYPEIGDALSEVEIEAVVISTPPSTHFPLVYASLSQGIHVFCEKPLCATAAETARLVSAAESAGVVLYEGLMFLAHPQFTQLRTALDSIGFQTLTARFGFPDRDRTDFRYSPIGGGALLDAGVYPIAAACELLDRPHVVASLSTFDVQTGSDTSGLVVVEDADRRVGILEWAFGRPYVNDISAWGDKGTVRCDRAFSKPPNLETSIVFETHDGVTTKTIEAANHFDLQFTRFANTVRGSETSQNDAILQRSRLIEDVRRVGAEHAGGRGDGSISHVR